MFNNYLINKKRKNVAILYIATGRYIVFWKNFYEACEKYFLPKHNKTYFIFTDNSGFIYENNENVVKVQQENLGWPNNTLMRFEMFLKIKEKLQTYDYLYFLNGTMLPVREINSEIFPTEKQGLMVTLHPGFYKVKREQYTYDENPKSLACIPKNKGKYYFMGGFNGGTSKAFLAMCEELNQNTHKDLDQGVIALWHDESHLNHFMLDKKPLILSPSFGFPEDMPYNQKNLRKFCKNYKMLIIDKSKNGRGGHDWLRGISDIKAD